MSKKQNPYSFRPDESLDIRIQEVLAATGLRPQALVEACVRESLDVIAGRTIKERQLAQQAYLARSSKRK